MSADGRPMTAEPSMSRFADPFFPEVERVLYDHSPLRQVVCQLRFPSILKIESAAPADFQEEIRTFLPVVRRQNQLPPNLPAEFGQMLGLQGGGASYSFLTENEEVQLSIASDSISLTAESYTRWEVYSGILRLSLDALARIYKPSFYSRIGIRYINTVTRSHLGISERKWSNLIGSSLIGELSVPFIEDHLLECRKAIRIKDEISGILLQHGTVLDAKSPEEVSYLLDADFYKDERQGVGDAEDVLERLHSRAGRVFRWCISQELHQALGPKPCLD